MITMEIRDRVGLITIDRHERRNALDVGHLDDLRTAIAGALADQVRVLVITGAGTTFSAGADLAGVYTPQFRDALYTALHALTQAQIPALAAVNGPAIGAGTQLALACDLRVVAPSARFAIPTAHNGLAVDPWTIRRLALLSNGGVARNLLLGAGTCTAEHALTCGLADRAGTLDDAVEWAAQIAALAPLSLAYSKRALEQLFEQQPWPASLDAAFEKCWTSADLQEGIQARTDKRLPNFKGR